MQENRHNYHLCDLFIRRLNKLKPVSEASFCLKISQLNQTGSGLDHPTWPPVDITVPFLEGYRTSPPPPPPPPPISIMVGLTDDLPILLETGLDCPSRSLLSCLGRDLESPAEIKHQCKREESNRSGCFTWERNQQNIHPAASVWGNQSNTMMQELNVFF